MKRPLIALFLILACATGAFAQTPALDTWIEWPNTTFDAWANQSGLTALHNKCKPSSGVGAAIGAWVSGAYHPVLDEWLSIRGGGHADGCLNGALALSFNPVPAWKLRTTPSPNAPIMDATNPDDTNFLAVYTDTSPSSVHGYGNTDCFIGYPATHPLYGHCVSSGGIFWSRAGKSVPEAVFIYKPSEPTYQTAYKRMKDRPGGYGSAVVWNPTRLRLFLLLGGWVGEWDPATDIYTAFFTGTTFGQSFANQVALDNKRQRVYVLSQGTPGNRLKVIDYAKLPGVKWTDILTEGGENVENNPGPGFAYVSSKDNRLIAWGKETLTIPPVPPATTPTTVVRSALYTLLDDDTCGRGTAPKCRWVKYQVTNPVTQRPPETYRNGIGLWNRVFVRGCDIWSVASTATGVWSIRPSFHMDTCGTPPPPPDTEAPVILIASPALTNGRPTVYGGTTPITFATNDNVGVTSVVVTLDGQVLTTNSIDTKTLPNGSYHTVTIRALDAAGNSAQSSVEFIAYNCPSCETPIPPTPTPTPANTWRLVPPPPAGVAETTRIGKHERCFKDTKRNVYVCAGGDRVAAPYNPPANGGEQGSDAGNPAITVLALDGKTIELAAPKCPAAPAIMPAFPDNVVWLHDTKRDLYRMYRGFYTGLNYTATACGRSDEGVLMKDVLFDPTLKQYRAATWPPSPYGYGTDGGGPTFGVYDPVTDSDYMFRKDGAWGAILLIMNASTNTWQVVKLGAHHVSGSEMRGLLRDAVVYRSSPTILNGKLYVMSYRTLNSALIEIDLTKPDTMEGQTAYRVPADFTQRMQNIPVSVEEIEGYAIAIKSKGIIVTPFAPGLTPPLQALYPWHQPTKSWLPTREVPKPPAVSEEVDGGNWIYDDASGELMIFGKRIPQFQGYGTWRYRWE